MQYSSLDDFLTRGQVHLAKGPIALVFAEDQVELGSTLRHHLDAGFKALVVFAPDDFKLPKDVEPRVVRVHYDVTGGDSYVDGVNAVIKASAGRWLYYCFNAEYLFYPFIKTRSISEMLAYHSEERRDAMLSYVVDLYAGDLDAHPNAVHLEDAHMDKSGYYALARNDPANHNHPKERQLDFFGGLRWRYEEHIPAPRRKIDRIALFRCKEGLELDRKSVV